jgi:hypothetical protein
MVNEVADFREPRPGDLGAVQPAYCFLAIHGRKYGLDLGVEGASVGDSHGVGRESLVGEKVVPP